MAVNDCRSSGILRKDDPFMLYIYAERQVKYGESPVLKLAPRFYDWIKGITIFLSSFQSSFDPTDLKILFLKMKIKSAVKVSALVSA
jgi:hypothetical protein